MIKPKTKKVLIVYRDFLSKNRGTPLRVKSLVNELLKDKELEIYSASRDCASAFGVTHLCLDQKNLRNIINLNKFIKNNNIDVVVFHTISSAYYLIPLFFLHRSYKRVLEMHGFFEEEAKLYNDISFLRYHRNKFIYSTFYRMCNLITTCSETATKKIIPYNKNTHTVYGGVDLTLFNPSLNGKKMSSNDNSKIIIGYAGNGRKWQGLEFLLNAFSVLMERDQSYSLRLLLSEPVNIPNITNVTVYDSVPHNMVAQFNADCDILVIPRLENTVNKISFPSKLMEYLAMGKPVIGSRTSDIHNIISNGETGMLYNPGDIEGFLNCVLKLKDSSLRSQIGENGFELVKSKYTWEKQGKTFGNLLKNLQ